MEIEICRCDRLLKALSLSKGCPCINGNRIFVTPAPPPAIIFVIDVEARRLHDNRQGGGDTNGNGINFYLDSRFRGNDARYDMRGALYKKGAFAFIQERQRHGRAPLAPTLTATVIYL